MASSPGGRDCETQAQRLLERLRLRTELAQSVGILGVWHACDSRQARHDLAAEYGQSRLAAQHMIAVVDAAADSRADPDMTWD